jgi:hypothetical protein
MRNIKILLALFAIVSLSFSCTTYENSGGGSGGGSNTRVVSKLIFEDIEDDYVDEIAFKYDSDGRITRVTLSDPDDEGCYDRYYYNYDSDNGLEIVNEWGDEVSDYSDIYYAELNDEGYIVEAYSEDEYEEIYFSYDSKGSLISVSDASEDWEYGYSYIWSSGNIVECEYMCEDYFEDYYESATCTFDYNNKSMSMVNLDLNLAIGWWEGALYIPFCGDACSWGDGLTGRKSKNFMTGWTYESDDYEEEGTIRWSYDEDGYPEEAYVESIGDDGDCYEFRMTIKYKN